MKVLVAIKRVIDFQVKIRVNADRSGVETSNVKMSMNPFDEIALEEAVRWKEQQKVSEVIVVTIGGKGVQETLRQALALGADRALHIQHERDDLETFTVAAALKALVLREQPHIVILGKQAIDDDSNQVGQMLAGLLDWPQGTFASKIEFDDQHIRVTREIDGGLEILQLTLPAVLTTDLRLNEPRFATLPNIMKAKAKPITVQTLDQLGITVNPFCETLHVEPPVKREAGIKIDTIKTLMAILKDKEEVLP